MNIGRSDIDWKSLSHNEIDRIIAERIEADNKRIEANGGKIAPIGTETKNGNKKHRKRKRSKRKKD